MVVSPVTVACLMVATVWLAASSPVAERSPERSANVLELNKEQSKLAADSLIAILNGVAGKLKAGNADLTADDVVSYLQDLANQVNGAEGLTRRQSKWDRKFNTNLDFDQFGGLRGNAGVSFQNDKNKFDVGASYSKPAGLGANLGYTYQSGNHKFGAGVGYSQNGGPTAGLNYGYKKGPLEIGVGAGWDEFNGPSANVGLKIDLP
ncbi:hypothetical protein BaRGS_00009778 [Batillaria attramentaria]|uniref:Porin domain-containing protein n=1 Tax=Batillaria attramentaria TaxID=370345 RepID=A0ABD0LJ23_9CAEN